MAFPRPRWKRKRKFGKSVQRILELLSSFEFCDSCKRQPDGILQETWEWLKWPRNDERHACEWDWKLLLYTQKISQIELSYLICIWTLRFHLLSFLQLLHLSRSISLSFLLLRITERMCGVRLKAYIPKLFVISSSLFMQPYPTHVVQV